MTKFWVVCVLLVGIGLPMVASATGDRLDMRLNSKKVDSRMAVPRLALGTLKVKEKEEQVEVKKKRVTSTRTVKRVGRIDNQRKRKTKRVVASQ